MITGAPHVVSDSGQDYRSGSADLLRAAEEVTGRSAVLQGSWRGDLAETALASWQSWSDQARALADAFVEVADVLAHYADELADAHRIAAAASPVAAAGAVDAERMANEDAARRIDAVADRVADALRQRGDRDPDGAGGGRLRSDELVGRPPGGAAESNGHLDSDWAGRAILGRYLAGGGDWHLRGDPAWSRYLADNPELAATLDRRGEQTANDAVARFRRGEGADGAFDVRESAQIRNGESMVGYDYLHGTNSDAGGFQRRGTTSVVPLPDGRFEVRVDSHYVWNDDIDPNPQYSTDRTKSVIAEVLTFGQAEAYRMSIGWSDSRTFVLGSETGGSHPPDQSGG